jgi:hypothetical protein
VVLENVFQTNIDMVLLEMAADSNRLRRARDKDSE